MKLTVETILNSVEPLKKIHGADFPLSISMKLMQNIEQLQNVVNEFENKRMATIEKHVDPDADPLKIPKAKLASMNEKVQEYLKEEIEIDINQIEFPVLEQVEDSLTISPAELYVISWLFKMNTPEVANGTESGS